MKSDYKILGKFIAILLTLLVILIAFNSNEAFFNTQKHNDSMFQISTLITFLTKATIKKGEKRQTNLARHTTLCKTTI